jgi:hypothetical protein
MERSLGYRLLDNMRETMKLESTKTELISALYTRKIYEETKNGIEAIEENLKVQASFYGIDYEEYTNRIEELKSNYIKEINRLNEEREFQFVNLQLELREARANQKISLVNAKKIYDSKEEFIKSDQYKEYLDKKEKLTPQLNLTLEKKDYKEYCTMLKELIDPLEIYNEKKEIALKKYNDYNSIITSCENKIEECMNETYEEIKNILNENIENSLSDKKENFIVKMINKLIKVIAGKTKFENKISTIENNIKKLSLSNNEKIEKIRNETIQLVAKIQIEKELLNKNVA